MDGQDAHAAAGGRRGGAEGLHGLSRRHITHLPVRGLFHYLFWGRGSFNRQTDANFKIMTVGASHTPHPMRYLAQSNVISYQRREEGVKGFWKGLSASYWGCSEGCIQFVVYEKLKKQLIDRCVAWRGIAWPARGVAGCCHRVKMPCVRCLVLHARLLLVPLESDHHDPAA
jgi:hypothetical protein